MAAGRVRIRAATTGPFTDWLMRERNALEEGVTGGVRAATEGLKLDLRRAIAASGLGPRLGKAVGAQAYPKRGASLGAAGSVFARGKSAERVLTAFSEGATIRARAGGRFLAIPTEHVPRAGRGGRRPMTPFEVESHFNTDLEPVPLRGGRGALLLVIPVVKGSGQRFRRVRARRVGVGRTSGFVPMFVLVPHVHLRKRFDAARLARKWAARVPELIERALPSE
ncbi:MAG: DUF6441 family protein [Alphaproteobacteria bacterium]